MEIKLRKLREIDLDTFCNDIMTSSLYTAPCSDLNALIEQYESVLSNLTDKHAPVITRNITCRPNAPWYNEELRKMKQDLRRLERRMNSSKLEVDRQIFKQKSQEYNKLINQTKQNYHKMQFETCNSRELFQKVDRLCKPKSEQLLPSENSSDTPLVERFSEFFTNKIKCIKDNLENMPDADISVKLSDNCHSNFSEFTLLSEDSVREIIMKSPSTTCKLDPIPTWLLKKCINELLPVITNIVNYSLRDGHFPHALKCAHITPLIKKPNADREILKNYRPVANLKFLAKTVERASASQIQDYLFHNDLYGKMQSAYRTAHSTETALLRVFNDLLNAVDKGHEAVLVLLDYSAAFDTISHDIFLKRLSQRYGISATALNWFKSYLIDRSQFVTIRDNISVAHTPEEGFPQGSVMGPLCFIMHTSPLEDIIEAHRINRMLYADDTQNYTIFKRNEHAAAIPKFEKCIKDVKIWSNENGQKLNDDKTEVLHISSRFRNTTSLSPLQIGDSSVDFVHNARNLGVVVEDDLKMDMHINNICRAASFALHRIGQIRKSLDQKSTETLIHAFITSRLDQCNSLLYGLPDCQIAKLQRIQNDDGQASYTYPKK